MPRAVYVRSVRLITCSLFSSLFYCVICYTDTAAARVQLISSYNWHCNKWLYTTAIACIRLGLSYRVVCYSDTRSSTLLSTQSVPKPLTGYRGPTSKELGRGRAKKKEGEGGERRGGKTGREEGERTEEGKEGNREDDEKSVSFAISWTLVLPQN